VGVDVEGPIVNPKADLAWMIRDELLSEETRAKYTREKCERYDEKYDDGRYFYELNKSSRHSTGTWPLLSLAFAAIDGITDDELIAYAEKTTQENPGTEKLMGYLLERFEGRVNLITSSYAPVGLSIAKKYGIPFKQVFTNGHQPSRKTLSQMSFEDEIKQRSPMAVLSEHKKELDIFMSKYVGICEALGAFYTTLEEKISQKQYDEKTKYLPLAIRGLRKAHDELFDKISDFRLQNTLKCMFLNEECIMGSHRKVDAMRSVHDDRRRWGYIGDGIVDGMATEYADFGISLNMTNKHALSLSKLNVATTDVSKLIPVLDAMFSGEFGGKLKDKLDSEEIRVFSITDIQQDIDAVVKVNREKKNELKALYVPVKI